MELERIPTVDFDPNQHVISCREVREGRQVFVTMQSLADDMRVYAPSQPDPASIPADLSLQVAREIMPELEKRFQALRDSIPPTQLSAETTAALGELTKAVIATNQRAEATQERVQRLEETLVLISQKLA